MCALNVVRNVSPENVFKRVQRVGFVNLYLPLRKKTSLFCIQISMPVSLTEVPGSQKLYLTTPLDVAFDPDLSMLSSKAYITFKSEFEEAVSQLSCLMLLVRDVL